MNFTVAHWTAMFLFVFFHICSPASFCAPPPMRWMETLWMWLRSCSILGGFTESLMVPAAAAVDLRSICQKVLKHSNLTLFPSNRRYTQKSQYTRRSRITSSAGNSAHWELSSEGTHLYLAVTRTSAYKHLQQGGEEYKNTSVFLTMMSWCRPQAIRRWFPGGGREAAFSPDSVRITVFGANTRRPHPEEEAKHKQTYDTFAK